jgi:hypothetical protein
MGDLSGAQVDDIKTKYEDADVLAASSGKKRNHHIPEYSAFIVTVSSDPTPWCLGQGS